MTKRKKTSSSKPPQYLINNCKKTCLYEHMYSTQTIKSCKTIGKSFKLVGISNLKKHELCTTLVANTYIRIIQKWFRLVFYKLPSDYKETIYCPISMKPLHEVTFNNRYFHSGYFFDKKHLSRYIHTSCDFLHPVTRVEFELKDVLEIDRTLKDVFENKSEIQQEIFERRGLIQNTEIELEALFKDMTASSREISSNREMKIVLDYFKQEFDREFENLMILDVDRAKIIMKSFICTTEQNQSSYYVLSTYRKNLIIQLLQTYYIKACT